MPEQNNHSAPTADIYRSEDGARWVVHIDTKIDTGRVTVYINDGDAVYDADPEVLTQDF